MAKLLIAMFLVASLHAQPGRAKLPGEDWVSLFNGADLKGWTEIGHEKWAVENGTIHGYATTKEYGYLRTDKNFVDFEMSLRFKCEGDGNSGGSCAVIRVFQETGRPSQRIWYSISAPLRMVTWPEVVTRNFNHSGVRRARLSGFSNTAKVSSIGEGAFIWQVNTYIVDVGCWMLAKPCARPPIQANI